MWQSVHIDQIHQIGFICVVLEHFELSCSSLSNQSQYVVFKSKWFWTFNWFHKYIVRSRIMSFIRSHGLIDMRVGKGSWISSSWFIRSYEAGWWFLRECFGAVTSAMEATFSWLEVRELATSVECGRGGRVTFTLFRSQYFWKIRAWVYNLSLLPFDLKQIFCFFGFILLMILLIYIGEHILSSETRFAILTSTVIEYLGKSELAAFFISVCSCSWSWILLLGFWLVSVNHLGTYNRLNLWVIISR